MNEHWLDFCKSGSVEDYLKYKRCEAYLNSNTAYNGAADNREMTGGITYNGVKQEVENGDYKGTCNQRADSRGE